MNFADKLRMIQNEHMNPVAEKSSLGGKLRDLAERAANKRLGGRPAEAAIADAVLRAENLVQNIGLVPGLIGAIAKDGIVGAAAGNPAAITGFLAGEIAQGVQRTAAVGALSAMSDSLRQPSRMKMRPTGFT